MRSLPYGRLVMVGLLVCAVAACSSGRLVFFKQRENQYRLAGTAPPLKLPADLNGVRVQPLLVVPELQRQTVTASVLDPIDPKPQSLNATGDDQYVKIQKLGERHWLVVGESPAVVWPRIKLFLANNRVALVADEPDAGRLETEWLALSDIGEDPIRKSLRKAAGDDLTRPAKLYVRVEPALRDGSAEIHVRESSDVLAQSDWPDKSSLGQAEELLLNNLGEFLAGDASDPAVSMRARHIAGTTKSELVKSEQGDPSLVLRLDFDRAWATVGQAMAKAELNVTDLNRSTGLFYVQVSEAELEVEKPGMVGRWFSGTGTVHKITLRMQPKIAGTGSNRANAESYALSLVPEQSAPLPTDFAERLLTLIQNNAG